MSLPTPDRLAAIASILDAWEEQQNAYVPQRDARFEIVLDAIESALPEARVILDIGGGPGSFSALILDRFPDATVVTLDYDPAMLALARLRLEEYGERSVVVEADLNDAGWPRTLGPHLPDAIVSSTALHFLSSSQLVALYERLASVLGGGGLFFNADHLSHTTPGSFFERVSTAAGLRQQAAFARGVPDWLGWWERLRRIEGFPELIDERNRRFADAPDSIGTSPALHIEALRVAGFAEAGSIWQHFDDYVIYGVR